MAKRVTNPKGFLIASVNVLEATLFRNEYIHNCEICNKDTNTLCYMACNNIFVCPDCMRRLVKTGVHVPTKEETINYDSLMHEISKIFCL